MASGVTRGPTNGAICTRIPLSGNDARTLLDARLAHAMGSTRSKGRTERHANL